MTGAERTAELAIRVERLERENAELREAVSVLGRELGFDLAELLPADVQRG